MDHLLSFFSFGFSQSFRLIVFESIGSSSPSFVSAPRPFRFRCRDLMYRGPRVLPECKNQAILQGPMPERRREREEREREREREEGE